MDMVEEKKRYSLPQTASIVLSICFVIFHLYTAFFGVIQGIGQKSIHLGFVMIIFYLNALDASKSKWDKTLLYVMLLFSVIGIGYITAVDSTLQERAGIVYNEDIIFGILLIIAILVATLRRMGKAIVIISLIFIIYGFLGQLFPGFLNHPGLTLKKFTSLLYLTTDGIFGIPLYACASFIFLFVLLGAILEVTGVGDYFTNIATSLFGKMRGGPAKVAIVASGLFGSISGSPTSNVIATGTFTIPLMKKSGYKPKFAGAVEAAASTGGALMPPIMGATAFIIAEIIGVSYFEIAKAALIPAILYYLALMCAVDIYARKYNLKGADISSIPKFSILIKKVYLMTPLIFLVFALGWLQLTVARAGLYTCLIALLISMFGKETRLNKEKLIKIAISASKSMAVVTIACAIAGIISGIVMGTGIGFRLSSVLIDVAAGQLIILLLLTMIVCLIMGMGVPTTAAYLVLAILVAPALIKMGVDKTAAHLFIFYFGSMSSITPPVALAAYAAAGISGSSAIKTGFVACRLAFSAFILAFVFAYNPVLLFQGAWYEILLAFASALLGMYMLAAAGEAYFIKWKINIVERIILLAASIGLIIPEYITSIVGLAVFISIFLYHKFNRGESLKSNSHGLYDFDAH